MLSSCTLREHAYAMFLFAQPRHVRNIVGLSPRAPRRPRDFSVDEHRAGGDKWETRQPTQASAIVVFKHPPWSSQRNV